MVIMGSMAIVQGMVIVGSRAIVESLASVRSGGQVVLIFTGNHEQCVGVKVLL